MSVEMFLRRATPEELKRAEGDPEAARAHMWEFQVYDDDEWPEADPVADARLTEQLLNMEKAWHLIHYMLAGDPEGGPWPASALLTARAINLEELERDPEASAILRLDPDEVREFDEHLRMRSDESLLKRFDLEAARQDGIYLANADPDGMDEYVFSILEELREFVSATAAAGDGLLIALDQ